MVAAVFSMQGLGQLVAAIVALITTVAFKESFIGAVNESKCGYECRLAADRAWRIIIGVGAVPACIALYYRITIPETPRYTFDIEHDVEKADADIKAYVASKSKGSFDVVHQVRTKRIAGRNLNVPRASWSDLVAFFRIWANFKMLLGTTLSWFFLVCLRVYLIIDSTNICPRISHSMVLALTTPWFFRLSAMAQVIRFTKNFTTRQWE